MCSTSSETDGSPSGRRLYVRYGIVRLHAEIRIKDFYKISKCKVFELLMRRYKHKTQKLNLLRKIYFILRYFIIFIVISACKQFIPYRTYSGLPQDESSGPELVDDIAKIKILV